MDNNLIENYVNNTFNDMRGSDFRERLEDLFENYRENGLALLQDEEFVEIDLNDSDVFDFLMNSFYELCDDEEKEIFIEVLNSKKDCFEDDLVTDFVQKIGLEDEELEVSVEDEPVVENDEPVVENDEPVVENDEPVVENDEPVVENDEPVVENDEPVVENDEPVVENDESNVSMENTVLDFEQDGPEITKYKNETEELRSIYNDKMSIVTKYNELNQRIDELTIEQYEVVKNEINELNANYPEDLKNELLDTLENKYKSLSDLSFVDDETKLINDNIYSESFATDLNFDFYAERLEALSVENNELVARKDVLNSEIQNLKEENVKLNSEFLELQEMAKYSKVSTSLYMQNLSLLNNNEKTLKEKEDELAKINNKIEDNQPMIEFYTDIINNKSDYLYVINKINDYHRGNLEEAEKVKAAKEERKIAIENEIAELNAEINDLTQKINNIEIAIEANAKTPNPINLDDVKITMEGFKIRRIETRNRIAELTNELESLELEIENSNELINTIVSELNVREQYYNIVESINNLIISKNVNEEEKVRIEASINELEDEELKAELVSKLEKTVIYVKENDVAEEKVIDRYIKETDELEADIQTRDNNISLYYEIKNSIINLSNDIKNGKDVESDEVKNIVEKINNDMKVLPETLQNELRAYLNNALSLDNKITNVEKNSKVWHKWLAGALGLAVGGATVLFTSVPAMGIILTATALKFGVNALHKHFVKKDAQAVSLSDENEITEIKKPNEKQKSVGTWFRNLMKNEDYIKNINWFLTGSIIGASVAGLYEHFNKPVKGVDNLDVNNTETNTLPQDTTTPSDIGTVEPSTVDAYSDIKLGDTVDGFNVSVGHDSSTYAVNGVNPEALNSTYVNNSSTFKSFYVLDQNGGVVDVITEKGTSISDLVARGYNPDQIAIDLGHGQTGGSQAWTTVKELISDTVYSPQDVVMKR